MFRRFETTKQDNELLTTKRERDAATIKILSDSNYEYHTMLVVYVYLKAWLSFVCFILRFSKV